MTHSQQNVRSGAASGWIWLWGLCSTIPMVPFTMPLLHDSWTDTPLAYLVWIPILAFCWAGWNLYCLPFNQDTPANVPWTGLLVTAFSGTVIIAGATLWPEIFAGHNDCALLLWPLWSAGVIALLFGAGTLRAVVKPFLYLLLVWPPLYLNLVSFTNPLLKSITLAVVEWFGRFTSWMEPGAYPGQFVIRTGSEWVRVSVTNACSGADMVLAIVVLFPIMLVVFKTSSIRKITLVIAGCLLAVICNIVRILLIMASLHGFGFNFAMKVVHPLLGPVLFVLLAGFLLLLGSRHMEKRQLPSSGRATLAKPAAWRLIVTVAAVIAMTVLLLPIYYYL